MADIGFDGTLSLESGAPKLSFMDEPVIEANEKLAYAVADRLRKMVLEFKKEKAEYASCSIRVSPPSSKKSSVPQWHG